VLSAPAAPRSTALFSSARCLPVCRHAGEGLQQERQRAGDECLVHEQLKVLPGQWIGDMHADRRTHDLLDATQSRHALGLRPIQRSLQGLLGASLV
jgi:hypothetical protein